MHYLNHGHFEKILPFLFFRNTAAARRHLYNSIKAIVFLILMGQYFFSSTRGHMLTLKKINFYMLFEIYVKTRKFFMYSIKFFFIQRVIFEII